MSQLVPFLTEDPLPPSRNRRSPVRGTVAALGVIALIVNNGIKKWTNLAFKDFIGDHDWVKLLVNRVS